MRGKKCKNKYRLQAFDFNMTTKTFNRKNKHKQHENIVYRVQCFVQRTYNMDCAFKLPDLDLFNDKGWGKGDSFL